MGPGIRKVSAKYLVGIGCWDIWSKVLAALAGCTVNFSYEQEIIVDTSMT